MATTVVLNNGSSIILDADVELDGILTQLRNKAFVVKVGSKVFQVGLIAAIATATALAREGKNVKLQINGNTLFTQVPGDLDTALSSFADDINANKYILFNGVLFDRGFYQLAEVIDTSID